jgi:hypothetical protein
MGHCGRQGFVDELTGEKLTKEERDKLKLEYRVKELERKQKEHERRLSALERMAKCTDHLTYHSNITNQALDYWWSQGMTNDSIDKYKLGYCDRCPTDRNCRPSYTTPVTYRNRLLNIRHRLIDCDSDKYRPHIPGLGVQLFNADNVHRKMPEILITEGEKKSIICEQEGFPNVGIIGKSGFRDEWVPYFGHFRQVNVLLDPDAGESAERLAAQFNGRGRVVTLPVKSDDFFFRYGGTKEDLLGFIKQAKPRAVTPNKSITKLLLRWLRRITTLIAFRPLS